MELDSFISRLAEALHPHPYVARMTVFEPPLRMLLVQDSATIRYSAAAVAWDDCPDPRALLGTVRLRVGQALDASWPFNCYALQLVVAGRESAWRPQIAAMLADVTGLHGVIIQGIHFIDPDTGARELNRSRWGRIRFGRIEPVVAALQQFAPPSSRAQIDVTAGGTSSRRP